MQSERKITVLELMSMNRRARRHLGKINGIKIPGIQAKIKAKEPKQNNEALTSK